MAFVQAVQFGRPPEKESVIDKINRGVSLAHNIISTVQSAEDLYSKNWGEEAKLNKIKIQDAQQNSALERRLRGAQATDLEDEAAFRKAHNGLGPTEYASLLKEKGGAKGAFEALPVENQEGIKEIARAGAGRRMIADSLKSGLAIINDPSLSDEQKLVQARSMIKTLNSDQGKDAVGAEEAKRLAGLLEFHFGNFTEPGPFIGRAPMSEFATQVGSKITQLEGTNAASDKEINRLYGRQSKGLTDLVKSKDAAPQGDLRSRAAELLQKRQMERARR
jgi:hypothetical protein